MRVKTGVGAKAGVGGRVVKGGVGAKSGVEKRVGWFPVKPAGGGAMGAVGPAEVGVWA